MIGKGRKRGTANGLTAQNVTNECNSMDDDGYPEQEDIDAIKNWKFDTQDDFVRFAQMIVDMWHWGDPYARMEGKRVKRLYLSTGGWSGNEELIGAIMDTMFWMICWQSSKRGGHYTFKIPEWRKEKSRA